MWCVVCRSCGFVGTRWEKPGTAASYVEYCPSCAGGSVLYQRVDNEKQHEAIKAGDIDFDDMRDSRTFEKYDL